MAEDCVQIQLWATKWQKSIAKDQRKELEKIVGQEVVFIKFNCKKEYIMRAEKRRRKKKFKKKK